MGAGTGFHADQAGRQLCHQRRQVFSGHLRLDQRRLADLIHPVHRKDVLGKIYPNRDNAHGLPLSWFQMVDFDISMSALSCRAASTPLPRDGEVPFIR